MQPLVSGWGVLLASPSRSALELVREAQLVLVSLLALDIEHPFPPAAAHGSLFPA